MKPKRTKLSANARLSRPRLLLFALFFALVGGVLLYKSFALNPNLPGDVNNDNVVNISDLSLLLSHYNQDYPQADFNSDGTINILDLSVILSNYGRTYSGPVTITQSIQPGQTLSGTVTWTASPSAAISKVSFDMDYNPSLSVVDTTAPYSRTLDTTQFANGEHQLGLSVTMTDGSVVWQPYQIGAVTFSNGSTPSSFGANIPQTPAYPSSLSEVTVTNWSELQSAVAAGNLRIKVKGRITIADDWRWTKPNIWIYGDPATGGALLGGAIKINTSNIWVSKLEIGNGIYNGFKLGDGAPAKNIVIADSWIHDVGDQGILFGADGAQDIWVLRNKIEKVGLNNSQDWRLGHGIYTGGYGGVTKRIYILANEFHPTAYGVHAYPEPDTVLIAGNSIIGGVTRGGIVWYSGARNVVAVGNLIIDAPSAAFEVASSDPAHGNRADENVCLRCPLWTPGYAVPPGSGNISTNDPAAASAFRVRADQWGWLPPYLKDGSARTTAKVGS